MVKGVLRLLKYSYDTKEWYMSLGKDAPDSLTHFLFDYISIEYEYWDNLTYNNFPEITVAPKKTAEKGAWDNFVILTELAFYAERMMCGNIQTELELLLKGPRNVTGTGYTNPVNPWDTSASNVPTPIEQAAFVGKYYNRILLQDYKTFYTRPNMNMVSRVGAGLKWLSDNPSSLASKNQIMPLFSAATKGEKKHCFGDTSAVHGSWDTDYFGYLLSGSSATYSPNPYLRNQMSFFEWEFLYQFDSVQVPTRFVFTHAEQYYLGSPDTCTFKNEFDTIIGFMWFNYSTLNNTTTTPHQYHRLGTNIDPISINSIIVSYSTENSLISIANKGELNGSYASLKIIDMNGRSVFNYNLQNDLEQISLKFLPPGIYFSHVISDNSTLVKKLIIIH